jgi:hypothetical protein
MKYIYLLLICFLLVGCKNLEVEPIIEQKEPAPVIIGFEILEKTIHNYIVATEAKGKFISLDVEISNVGEEAVVITREDIELRDKDSNVYLVEEAVSYYREDKFSEIEIDPGEKETISIAFDVPDVKEDFKLIIKGKKGDIE